MTHTRTDGRGIFSAVVLFLTGFIAIAALLHLFFRDPLRLHADMRTEKLAVLDQWQGKAASAAFGSSHVHNGFDPRVFDKALAGSPLQTRTINLAIAGGSQSEQRVTALEYLAHLQPPPRTGAATQSRACMVLLELNAGANFTSDHLVHPRTINIYDLDTARFESRLADSSLPAAQRFGRIGFALVAAAMHYANVGMLSNAIFTVPVDTATFEAETIDDRRGMLVVPPLPYAPAHMRQLIAESPKQPTPSPQPILPGNRDLLEELDHASPIHHLQLVYFTMPKLSDLTSYPVFPDSIEYAGTVAPIVNMSRPDQFAEIYNVKYWNDEAHLNQEGAALFTRLLAGTLKSWYAAHGEPAPCGG